MPWIYQTGCYSWTYCRGSGTIDVALDLIGEDVTPRFKAMLLQYILGSNLFSFSALLEMPEGVLVDLTACISSIGVQLLLARSSLHTELITLYTSTTSAHIYALPQSPLRFSNPATLNACER